MHKFRIKKKNKFASISVIVIPKKKGKNVCDRFNKIHTTYTPIDHGHRLKWTKEKYYVPQFIFDDKACLPISHINIDKFFTSHTSYTTHQNVLLENNKISTVTHTMYWYIERKILTYNDRIYIEKSSYYGCVCVCVCEEIVCHGILYDFLFRNILHTLFG